MLGNRAYDIVLVASNVPEARGLVTRGPYRLVRHPIYLGEYVGRAGLTVRARSWYLAGSSE